MKLKYGVPNTPRPKRFYILVIFNCDFIIKVYSLICTLVNQKTNWGQSVLRQLLTYWRVGGQHGVEIILLGDRQELSYTILGYVRVWTKQLGLSQTVLRSVRGWAIQYGFSQGFNQQSGVGQKLSQTVLGTVRGWTVQYWLSESLNQTEVEQNSLRVSQGLNHTVWVQSWFEPNNW